MPVPKTIDSLRGEVRDALALVETVAAATQRANERQQYAVEVLRDAADALASHEQKIGFCEEATERG